MKISGAKAIADDEIMVPTEMTVSARTGTAPTIPPEPTIGEMIVCDPPVKIIAGGMTVAADVTSGTSGLTAPVEIDGAKA